MSDRVPLEPTPTDRIDWAALRSAAIRMTQRSYAPYSGLRVGAAAVCADGRIVTGCNVENASTGLGICAEVNLCGHLVAAGAVRPIALSVVGVDGRAIAPCGRCRQVLYEFAAEDLLIELDGGVVTLGELLPHPFGPEHLDPPPA